MIGQQWYENESDAAAAGTSAQAATLCTECRIFPTSSYGQGLLGCQGGSPIVAGNGTVQVQSQSSLVLSSLKYYMIMNE